MIQKLTLNSDDKRAEGTQRTVYMHPHDPTRLVKVLRDIPQTAGRTRLATLSEQYFPSIRRRWVHKEYQEYKRLMLCSWDHDLHPPIAHMYGFVLTNLGLGCLTDAVFENDDLGETLRSKLKNKTLTAADLVLFNDTVRRMYLYDVRAGDMTACNFVFGQRRLDGTHDPRECVLVDGFGDIHALPIRSCGRFFNRIGLDDGCKRLAQRTGLLWDPKTRQFNLS